MILDVDVDVIAPVMVAALVSGNDIVGVIDAVGDSALIRATDALLELKQARAVALPVRGTG